MQDVSSTADAEWQALSTVEGLMLLGGFRSFKLREVAASLPPRPGWPIARSPTTLTSAVLPAFNARSSAGRNSSGRST